MQSHYEVNVSLHGKHLFATHERSAVNEAQLSRILEIFRDKFPAEEGYEITATHWECGGRAVYTRRADPKEGV